MRGLYNFDEVDIDYSRDDNSLFEAFKAGLIDYREETDPHRWTGGYDFPARRDGRAAVETLPLGGPRHAGLRLQHEAGDFSDARLREALAMMFDFEWINADLYSNLYTRTKSFFDESELSSSGRPASAAERALLAPFPGAVRADVMAGKWMPPRSDGSGRDRELARRALDLAAQAGWRLRNGVLTRQGRPLFWRSSSPTASRSGWRSIIPASCAASASRRTCGWSTTCNSSAGGSVSIST